MPRRVYMTITIDPELKEKLIELVEAEVYPNLSRAIEKYVREGLEREYREFRIAKLLSKKIIPIKELRKLIKEFIDYMEEKSKGNYMVIRCIYFEKYMGIKLAIVQKELFWNLVLDEVQKRGYEVIWEWSNIRRRGGGRLVLRRK